MSDVIAAPPGWAATATRGATIPSGTDRGALAPSTAMTVRVGLNLHNVDQLANAIAATAMRAPLSSAQFASQYGPTASEVQSVVSYLQSQGFTNVHADTQLVSADGTAAQVGKAFNTSLEAFSLGGANVYVNTQPAFVPASLGGIVSAVLGLSNPQRCRCDRTSPACMHRVSSRPHRPASARPLSTPRTCARSTTCRTCRTEPTRPWPSSRQATSPARWQTSAMRKRNKACRKCPSAS